MNFKLISAETAQKLSRINYKKCVEKAKRIELEKIMEWIQNEVKNGNDHLFIYNNFLNYEENRKVIEELGYKIEDVFDYGKNIIWDEKKKEED